MKVSYTKIFFERKSADRKMQNTTQEVTAVGSIIKAKKVGGKQTPEALAKLLQEYPEGIYVHASRYGKDGNKTREHTVVIISCKETSGKYSFRVSDPARGCYDTKPGDSVLMKTNRMKFSEIDLIVDLYTK